MAKRRPAIPPAGTVRVSRIGRHVSPTSVVGPSAAGAALVWASQGPVVLSAVSAGVSSAVLRVPLS